jgi:adenylate cyclase class 2
MLEVELKFRLDDVASIRRRLSEWGATETAISSHCDRYFNHPSRDFRTTDEAFRIRSIDDRNCITYKGPVIGAVAKTRHEIEIGFEEGNTTVERLVELVDKLGFRFVREVRKTRTSFEFNRDGRRFELSLDHVPSLGDFFEIELIVPEEERETAEAAIWKIASEFGLTLAEPRSYLKMLLQADGWTDTGQG